MAHRATKVRLGLGRFPERQQDQAEVVQRHQVLGVVWAVGVLGDGHRAAQVALSLGRSVPSWRSDSPRLFSGVRVWGWADAVGLLGEVHRAAQVRLGARPVSRAPSRTRPRLFSGSQVLRGGRCRRSPRRWPTARRMYGSALGRASRADGGPRPGCSAAAGSRGGRCRRCPRRWSTRATDMARPRPGCPSTEQDEAEVVHRRQVLGVVGAVGVLGDGDRATQIPLSLGGASELTEGLAQVVDASQRATSVRPVSCSARRRARSARSTAVAGSPAWTRGTVSNFSACIKLSVSSPISAISRSRR